MGNLPKCSDTHAFLNHMLKLWGVKINKDDLAQYKDTIVEHNPLLPEKKRSETSELSVNIKNCNVKS